MTVWCERLVLDGVVHDRVRLTADATGATSGFITDASPAPGDLVLGTAVPGAANAHSHAFHRALRGRTHGDGGDFWTWRELMYRTASRLTPARYRSLAAAVFAEMLTAGYTAVGEFHYVHHQPGGTPYPHEMELAVAAAAADVGIRLTLLDTAYLAGGVGERLSAEQARFGDGSAEAYLRRWQELSTLIPGLGAAIHSVRAVSSTDIRTIVEGLPDDVPVHIHLSEQPKENEASLAAYGVTPTGLLAREGVLSTRVSVVHATHLTEDDVRELGGAGVSVVMCPTTEGDLGDGIGPARELLDAGATIAVGSDQNAVVDPLLEIRGLEIQDRLRSLRRGRFSMPELGTAMSAGGYRSLARRAPLSIGGLLDLVEIDTRSVRTIGAEPDQLLLCATAADVRRVVVGGRVAASAGRLADGRQPADMLAEALEEVAA
ncbi:formimidoylglutamate deiminase [Microbacterium sp. NPDC064584]|uniref:formimidoylglutamate deiminase n=1 Tax=Microbacterium sp. NPDC064584 TaxID=3155817 RepID=UPI003431FB10